MSGIENDVDRAVGSPAPDDLPAMEGDLVSGGTSDGTSVADEEFELVQEIEPELPLPVWEPTGDAAVDAALDELMRLDQMGTADHVEVYSAVHSALHRRLSELEA